MKRRALVVLVAVMSLSAAFGLNLLTPGTARAQGTDICDHAPTIVSLVACVEHCAAQGLIDNQGVTNSLLAKLDATQAALDRGQTAVATSQLDAFIDELEAQAGKHIVLVHAQDMVLHAQMFVDSLDNG